MEKKDLERFEGILQKRKAQILAQLNDDANEIEGLLSSEPNDNVDFSTINTSSQIEQAIAENLRVELDDIALSLQKIKQNTYGICELCGENIDLNRLKIKPHARYCKNCRESVEKENK